jgi:HSP20 family protein
MVMGFEGTFSRQAFLGKGFDADRFEARYNSRVLTLTIPVAEQPKPRRAETVSGQSKAQPIDTTAKSIA